MTIDETPKPSPTCCPGHDCSLLHKTCIKKYFIRKNAPLKPSNIPLKIFDLPRDKISIKKEIVTLPKENEENNNPDDVQVIEFDNKYDDPAKWPSSLTQFEIDHIVDKGSVPTVLESYPLDANNRCFSADLYTYKSLGRFWLAYSVEKDAAFCVACKLFSKERDDVLCEEGLRDWRYIRSKLINHNSKKYHTEAIIEWLDRFSEIVKAKPKIDQNIIEL